MEFLKYNSIENSYKKMLEKFLNSPLYKADELWYVTEKVHGSNFGIFFDKNEGKIIPSNRNAFLDMNKSNFYNFQKIFEKHDMFGFANYVHFVVENYEPLYTKYLSIHGELCGGSYKDMPVIPGVKKIQKEIQYSNDVEFIIFDIRCYNGEGRYIFLPHPMIIEIVKMWNSMSNKSEKNINAVPVLFSGSMIDCLEWSSNHNADPSEIWKIFGMPHEVPNNIREGHVIKPHSTIFMGMDRVIFKDKNDKFRENTGSKEKKIKTKKNISVEVLQLISDSSEMICKPRFDNITSKFGGYDIGDFNLIMNCMKEDIIEELKKDEDSVIHNISENNMKIFNDMLIKNISSWMGKNKKELF